MRWKRLLGIIALAGIIVILAGIGILATYDFNKLKPRIADAVKAYTGREIHLDGDIKFGMGLTPKLKVKSAAFQNAAWGSRADLARIKQLELHVELLPLIQGMVKVKRLSLLEPDILIEVNRSGKSNLAFDLPATSEKASSQPAPDSKSSSTADVFAIRDVYLEKAKLRIKDHRTGKTTTLDIDKFTLKAPGYDEPPDVKAEAVFNGTAFRISGSLGAVSDLFGKQEPWPIQLTVNALGADLMVAGTIDDPLSLKGADLQCSVSGNVSTIFEAITGRRLPQSPFSLSGHLLYRASDKIEVTGLQLKLADSAVNGTVTLERRQGVPLIVAHLKSDNLDLRPLLGNDQKTSPKEEKSQRPASKKVFPDKPFAMDYLSRFETSVDAEIARLMLPGMAAEALGVKAALRSGRFGMNLVASNIGGGRLTVALDLVPQGKQIDASASVNAKSVDLGRMLKGLKISSAIEGKLDLTAKLKGRGNSVAGLMAGLDGDFIATLDKGRMPLAYLNLIGTDISTSLLQLLNPFDEPMDEAAFNCLVVDFNIAKGQAKSDVILIDDPRKALVAQAEVNLKTEDLDVWIETEPKEGIGLEETGKVSISLKELTKPFKVGGTLAHPEVELDTLQTAKTVGTALLGPAGILWLMVSGSAGNVDPCASALKIAGEGVYKEDAASGEKKGLFDQLKKIFK